MSEENQYQPNQVPQSNPQQPFNPQQFDPQFNSNYQPGYQPQPYQPQVQQQMPVNGQQQMPNNFCAPQNGNIQQPVNVPYMEPQNMEQQKKNKWLIGCSIASVIFVLLSLCGCITLFRTVKYFEKEGTIQNSATNKQQELKNTKSNTNDSNVNNVNTENTVDNTAVDENSTRKHLSKAELKKIVVNGENALDAAKNNISVGKDLHESRSTVIEMMTGMGFTKEVSADAIDSFNCDWEKNAEETAKAMLKEVEEYKQETSTNENVSKTDLIEMVVREGFTKEEATQAVNQVM